MQREDGIGEGIVIEEECPEWGSLSGMMCAINQSSRAGEKERVAIHTQALQKTMTEDDKREDKVKKERGRKDCRCRVRKINRKSRLRIPIHRLTRKKKRKCRKSGRVVVVVVVKGLYPCDGGIWLDMRMLFKR